MGQFFDKPQAAPDPGCFFVWRNQDNVAHELVNWVTDGRVQDCDCRARDTCANGPPPMPPWEEFIRPLLDREGHQPDFIVPEPTAVYPPDTTALPWDWRPADLYPWPSAKPELQRAREWSAQGWMTPFTEEIYKNVGS